MYIEWNRNIYFVYIKNKCSNTFSSPPWQVFEAEWEISSDIKDLKEGMTSLRMSECRWTFSDTVAIDLMESRVNQVPVKKWQLHLTIIYTPAIYHQHFDFYFGCLVGWVKVGFFVINNRTLKKYVKRRSLWICVICGQSCAWGGVWTSSSLFGDKPSSEHQQHTMRHTWGNVLKLSKA